MESKEEWCADKLSKLLNEDLRISTLNEIKEHFQEISDSEATQTAELLQLPLVFDCLNNSNNEQVDLACEVLSLCLEKLDIGETATRYSIPLERALTHPNSGVKLMALEEFSRIIKCDTTTKHQLVESLARQIIFSNIIRCIGDENLKVAAAASNIVICFGGITIDCLINPNIISIIKETMGLNEIVRLRFYEIFIDISLLSKEYHDKIISSGFLSPMIHEISSKDILLRLNIIEMLYKLVECSYGYEFLESEGFMDKLFKQFIEEDDPIFTQICEPGILKFVGHMAHCKPNQVFNKYPQIIDKIFTNLETSEYTIVKVSLETIAYIASVDPAILDSFVGAKMLNAIRSMSEKLQNLPTKEKIVCLDWFKEILLDPKNDNSSQICSKWFQNFGSNPMDVVMHYTRNPFEELRLAGLGVLHSLTMHRWGQELINRYAGLVEYLLDRSGETSKAVKEQKYFIVKSIFESNMGVFSHATMLQFESFVKQGAYFVQAVTEVAVEGNE